MRTILCAGKGVGGGCVLCYRQHAVATLRGPRRGLVAHTSTELPAAMWASVWLEQRTIAASVCCSSAPTSALRALTLLSVLSYVMIATPESVIRTLKCFILALPAAAVAADAWRTAVRHAAVARNAVVMDRIDPVAIAPASHTTQECRGRERGKGSIKKRALLPSQSGLPSESDEGCLWNGCACDRTTSRLAHMRSGMVGHHGTNRSWHVQQTSSNEALNKGLCTHRPITTHANTYSEAYWRHEPNDAMSAASTRLLDPLPGLSLASCGDGLDLKLVVAVAGTRGKDRQQTTVEDSSHTNIFIIIFFPPRTRACSRTTGSTSNTTPRSQPPHGDGGFKRQPQTAPCGRWRGCVRRTIGQGVSRASPVPSVGSIAFAGHIVA